MDSTFHSLHCGIVRGRPVTLPTLAMKLLLSGMKRRGKSCAIFFIDSATAYYSIVRELALGPITGDPRCLRSSRLWLELRMLPRVPAVQSGGLPILMGLGPLMCLLRNVSHRRVRNRFCTGDKVCCTRVGSRPGSTFADLVFA